MNKDLMLSRSRCTARRKNGTPCRNWAIRGGNVCRMHGGGAKQVKRKAQERLVASADMFARRLIEIATDARAPYAVRLAAIRDGLDRAGLGAKQHVELEVPLWAQDLQEIIVDDIVVEGGDAPTDPRFEKWNREVLEGEIVDRRNLYSEPAEEEDADTDTGDEDPPRALPAGSGPPPVQPASVLDVPPKYLLDSLPPDERRAVIRQSVRGTGAPRPSRRRGRPR